MKAISTIRRFQKENKGVTMAELLVVIAILCIAVGITGLSISLVNSRDSEKCARIIEELLEEARRDGMTMPGNFTLKLDTQNHKVEIICLKDDGTRETVTSKTLPSQVAVSLEAAGTGMDISADTSLEVKFNKGNGRVKSVESGGRLVDGTLLSIHCDSDKRRVTVVLVWATGKHYLNYEGR